LIFSYSIIYPKWLSRIRSKSRQLDIQLFICLSISIKNIDKLNNQRYRRLILLKREVSDRLPSDFKKIFTAWKSCQVMIETLYKKCIASVGQQLWQLKHLIFNRDSYVLYKFTRKLICSKLMGKTEIWKFWPFTLL